MTTNTRRTTRTFLLATVTTVIVAGCGNATVPAAAPATSGQQVTTTIQGDFTREIFPDIAALIQNVRKEGGSIVLGTVSASVEGPGAAGSDGTPIKKGEIGYQPATDSTVTVQQRIGGKRQIPDTFKLHQPLPPASEYAELPKLTDGNTYLMVVRPFTFGNPNTATGQYVVAGFQGAWQQVQPGQFDWISKGRADIKESYPTRLDRKGLLALFGAV